VGGGKVGNGIIIIIMGGGGGERPETSGVSNVFLRMSGKPILFEQSFFGSRIPFHTRLFEKNQFHPV
jgi:hypothetical protein